MPDKYILDGKIPKPVDLLTWARWFETADRRIDKTTLPDGVEVSTVFLGLDHSYSGKVPILFETMIFGGEHDQYQDRYTTWEEAEAGHKSAVKMAKTEGKNSRDINPWEHQKKRSLYRRLINWLNRRNARSY